MGQRCDVAALRCELSRILGTELGAVCVWGELMCNPGFYEYNTRGLAAKWLCFGVVAAVESCSADEVQRLSQQLKLQGFAYSLSNGGKLRLMVCPALRRLLTEVAGCDVVDEQFQGLTHAEV